MAKEGQPGMVTGGGPTSLLMTRWERMRGLRPEELKSSGRVEAGSRAMRMRTEVLRWAPKRMGLGGRGIARK